MSRPDPVADYDFVLPPERIAQAPAAERDGARLFVLDRAGGGTSIGRFRDIGGHLRAGDLLVVNDARVFPARLPLARSGGGGAEVLLLEPAAAAAPDERDCWEALVRPARWARRLARDDVPAPLGQQGVALRVRREIGEGRFLVNVERHGDALPAASVIALCERLGEVPLPPYIGRDAPAGAPVNDRERYQTVYAREPLAVAAPTAGLHFTPALLAALEQAGVERVAITHQVGLGTFQPIRVDDLRLHRMHTELASIDAAAGEAILAARRQGRRIVAVGTTTVRALESFARAGTPRPFAARTDLFIRPGHRFALVDALITNFHLPRSSLLVLVSAFAGRERILEAYRRAIELEFRFYSYGDAMLIL